MFLVVPLHSLRQWHLPGQGTAVSSSFGLQELIIGSNAVGMCVCASTPGIGGMSLPRLVFQELVLPVAAILLGGLLGTEVSLTDCL